ncbi:MAG TPA: D-Ala-D-Ala carboxypeptidase family metallohydrolase [Dongiaceae bacterium]|jgi:putative chitinase|nr:D-Ala-D-Ala carboxypeptidase family metallohydrolase [Dongiaceae bacterium]
MQLSPHFSLEQFTRSDAADSHGIDNAPTPEHLVNLRNLAARMEAVLALFDHPIKITSGYRNPQVNEAVGGSKTSAHSLGHAADFHVEGLADLDAAKRIRDSELEFDQLIYEENRCVHISFDPRKRRRVNRQPGGPNTPVFDGLEP